MARDLLCRIDRQRRHGSNCDRLQAVVPPNRRGGDSDSRQRRASVTDNVRQHLERILGSYEDINRRFTEVGGIGKLLGLFEDVKRELERVTGEIKGVVEDLLKVDYELRKVQNLKLLFEQRRPSLGADSAEESS